MAYYSINGKCTHIIGVGGSTMLLGEGFWRIDDLTDQRTGTDFLAYPPILVRDEHVARLIVELLNSRGVTVRTIPPVPADGE